MVVTTGELRLARPLRDPGAELERLYRNHSAELLRHALRVLGSRSDAEDATQAVFVRALRALERGERVRAPRNWLIKIAHNECRRALSSRRLHAELPEQLPSEPQEAGRAAELQRALEALPESQRHALVLRELEGRTYAEIADSLKISHSAVETLIFRARRAVREQLEAAMSCEEFAAVLDDPAARPLHPRPRARVPGVRAPGAPGPRPEERAAQDRLGARTPLVEREARRGRGDDGDRRRRRRRERAARAAAGSAAPTGGDPARGRTSGLASAARREQAFGSPRGRNAEEADRGAPGGAQGASRAGADAGCASAAAERLTDVAPGRRGASGAHRPSGGARPAAVRAGSTAPTAAARSPGGGPAPGHAYAGAGPGASGSAGRPAAAAYGPRAADGRAAAAPASARRSGAPGRARFPCSPAGSGPAAAPGGGPERARPATAAVAAGERPGRAAQC